MLELASGTPLLVIEAKRLWALPDDGIQQAMRYARLLDAPYALSTNGTGWVVYDAATGEQAVRDDVPTPAEAWDQFVQVRALATLAQDYLRSGFSRRLTNSDGSVRELRYYQRRAVHEVLCAMAAGERRILLVMATGAGKTFTALQLVWKLWNHRRHVQRVTDVRNYRVLYLADRDVLVGHPLNTTFRPVLEEAATRVRSARATHAPDVYFATYQALDVPDTGDGSSTSSGTPAIAPSSSASTRNTRSTCADFCAT